MIELDSHAFLGALTQMRALITLLNTFPDKTVKLGPQQRAVFLPNAHSLIAQLAQVRARGALAPARRLQIRLDDPAAVTTVEDIHAALWDIESRFVDHLHDLKLIVIDENEAPLFAPADTLLSFAGPAVAGFSSAFPNAAFEIEEAAKCIALNRYTAAVFHCMRTIESGIKAFATLIGVPDPASAGDRNWGAILKKIRDAMDAKWPPKTRLPGSDASKLEVLYAHLDAVRNPWRNATMHVETIYAPHEAIHIARCTAMFMLELMKHCDEQGRPPTTAPAMATQVSQPADEPAL